MSLRAGSGGVSVRAGASPSLRGRRAAMRSAMRRATVRVGRGGGRRGDADPDLRAPGAALLCGNCGRMTWPPESRGLDPHRVDTSVALVRPDPCAHCGQISWLDLRNATTALALREEAHRGESRWRRTLVTSAFMGGAWAAAGVIWATASSFHVVSWLPVIVMGMTGATLGALYEEWQRSRTVVEPPALPVRWIMALPPAGETRVEAEGPIEASGELLRAPITGRPCVGYELGLREDEDGDGDPETWTLLEQRLAAAAVAGRDVPTEGVHLRLDRESHWLVDQWDDLDEAARAHLLRLGFDRGDEGVYLFETILAPGTPVELARGAGGLVLRPQPGSSTNG